MMVCLWRLQTITATMGKAAQRRFFGGCAGSDLLEKCASAVQRYPEGL